MPIEHKGPGGVSNGYGVRVTVPSSGLTLGTPKNIYTGFSTQGIGYIGVSAPPTIYMAMIQVPGSVAVYFSPPDMIGGSQIIGYRVTLSDGTVQTGTNSPITVTTTGTTPITATVQALNASGYSASSGVSNTVIPTVSAATNIVSASVRTKIPMTTNQFSASFPVRYSRTHDKTNVTVANPYVVFWNGYAVSTGASLSDLERGANYTTAPNAITTYEYSMITGITGRGIDQTGGTLTRATFNALALDPSFISAGGTVTNGGFTANVPENFVFQSDPFPFTLNAGDHYFHQVKVKGLDTLRYPSNITGHGAGVGDLLYNAAGEAGPGATGDLIISKNWVGVTSPSQFGATLAPWMTLGTGSPTVKVIVVEGDSIICEVGGSSALGLSSNDTGDADGCQNFAKRALNAAGRSFIDVSVSGTNARDLRDLNASARRQYGLSFGHHVITDMLHNDRASLRAFNSASGLGTLYTFHNDWLRSKIKPGGKVIRTTLSPATNAISDLVTLTSVGTLATASPSIGTSSLTTGQQLVISGATPAAYNGTYVITVVDGATFTYTFAGASNVAATGSILWSDGWAGQVIQAPKNGDSTYPGTGEAGLTGGQFTLGDKIMRRGAYASLPYGGAGECDGGFDFAQYVQSATPFKFFSDGTFYGATDDGTHPKPSRQILAAAALTPLIPTLFGT